MENLVILSGWGMKTEIWQKFIENFKENFNIYILSWENVKNLNDFNKLTEDLCNEIDGNFYIVAWSLGSLLAISVERQFRNRIKKIVLLNPTSKFIREAKSGYKIGWNKRVINKMIDEISIDKEKVLNEFYSNMFSKFESIFKDNFINKYGDKIDIETKSLIIGLKFLLSEDVRLCLEDYNTNTLIIHGKDDNISPIDGAVFINNKISNVSRCHKVEDGGHILFWSKEELVVKIIKDFFNL